MKRAKRTIDLSHLSPGVRAMNPDLVKMSRDLTNEVKILHAPTKTGVRKDKPDEEKMNGTERDFLAWTKRCLTPSHVVIYQPIRLRWGGNMHYKPDFGIRLRSTGAMRLIEVKGPHIFSRDIVRFKGCRAEWQDLFSFEMWQVDSGIWRQIL
jgi:hypothetical protein